MIKYLIGGIVGALVMFGLSYTWHNVLLSDFEKLMMPKALFFSLLLMVYFAVSVVFTYIFSHYPKYFTSFGMRLTFGAVTGFFLYLTAFTLNFGLVHHEMKHLIVDFSWQMFEQAVGALSAGVVVSMSKKAKSFVE